MEYKIINGAISFDGETILEEINFEIKDHDKIAIVGRNGSGKTSLLRAILDSEMLEKGLGLEELRVVSMGNPTIGYQEQQVFSDLNMTLLEEILKVYRPIIVLKNKIDQLEKRLEDGSSTQVLDDYMECLDRFKLMGGYTYQKEYEVALLKFGFSKEDKNKKLVEFSGGQRTKISFLKLLLSKPDILLLDEPTNHLDIVTVEWLEKYLRDYPKAVVVVSHDRMFLDRVVNQVYEIEYATLTKYKGNYSAFERQKKMNYEKQWKDYVYQQREMKRLKEIADRFRYKPSKASMALSKLKKIEQMQVVEKPKEYDTKNFYARLKINSESSYTVLSVRNLEIGYDDVVLANVSFSLYKGQKVAIIGENGKGKSTLMKTLMGKIPKIRGKYTYGYQVEKEYFDQEIVFLNEENTVYEEYAQTFVDEDPEQIRKSLGAFLFTGEEVFKKVKVLSGGEKVRLALCKILKKNPNLLLLDEPTNHLDILGKENLENMLTGYQGSVLFVSHDRYFVNKMADALLVFEENEVVYFNGKYSEYLKEREKEKSQDVFRKRESSSKERRKGKEVGVKKSATLVRKLESEIARLEQEKKNLEGMMLEESVYRDYQKMNELQARIRRLDEEIDAKMEEWEQACNL